MVRSAPSYRVSWSCRGRRSILGRGCMVLFAHRFRPAHYPLARVAADSKMTSAASGCGSLFSEFDGARPPATVRSNDDGAVGAELPGQLVLPGPAIDIGQACMVLFARRFRPAHYPLARVAADSKMTSAASGCGSLFSEFDGARPPATVRSNDGAPSYRVSWSCRGRRSILGRGCMVLFAHRFRPAHYPLARVAADSKMTSAASGCGSLFSEFDGARPPATVRSNDGAPSYRVSWSCRGRRSTSGRPVWSSSLTVSDRHIIPWRGSRRIQQCRRPPAAAVLFSEFDGARPPATVRSNDGAPSYRVSWFCRGRRSTSGRACMVLFARRFRPAHYPLARGAADSKMTSAASGCGSF